MLVGSIVICYICKGTKSFIKGLKIISKLANFIIAALNHFLGTMSISGILLLIGKRYSILIGQLTSHVAVLCLSSLFLLQFFYDLLSRGMMVKLYEKTVIFQSPFFFSSKNSVSSAIRKSSIKMSRMLPRKSIILISKRANVTNFQTVS